MRTRLLVAAVAVFVSAVVLALGAALPASGAESRWVCGPGPPVTAEVVPGGLEVTSVPEGTVRLRFRAAADLAGHGEQHESVYADANDVPLFYPAPEGLPALSVLAKGPWEHGNPYPSLGCPTERVLA